MDADAFISRLRQCAPDPAELARLGLPPDAADRFAAKYHAERRTGGRGNDNELLDLLARYHAETLEIGMIQFLANAEKLEAGWQVGKAEADPLLVERRSGLVQVRELGNEDHVIWQCAANSNRFLDALAHAACFISQLAVDHERATDNIVLFDVANTCAELAGGSAYLNFYEMLMGCDIE